MSDVNDGGIVDLHRNLHQLITGTCLVGSGEKGVHFWSSGMKFGSEGRVIKDE